MATRQTEVPGTERQKISKKAKELIDEHRDAINACTKANKKRNDTKNLAIARLKEEGVEFYVDTEAEPPIEIDARDKQSLVIKKHRSEKPKAEKGAEA